MANLFLVPQKIISGKGALVEASSYLKVSGNKALIVTDKMMVSIGNVKKLIRILDEQAINYELFAEVNSEPTDQMVDQGMKIYREAHCDFLIAMGGGSPIDTMKAIGAMLTNPGRLADYMGKEITALPPKLIAIPTTAGTGSEATQFTIISDTKTEIKMLLKGAVLMPYLAIIDPDLTVTAPPKVTSGTGIDALTHAIEAYTSKKAQSLSDIFALSACKRIFKNLRTAYRDGANLDVRNEMSLAALEAGIAFNNSSVTLVHGMSRPIGALFHVPHGISNAMLIAECLSFAMEGAQERFANLAKAVGFYEAGMTDHEAAQRLLAEIKQLCSELQIPTLEQFGVDRHEFFEMTDKMAQDALASGSPGNTLRTVGRDEIITIYKKLWK